jgi:hypothetical protein
LAGHWRGIGIGFGTWIDWYCIVQSKHDTFPHKFINRQILQSLTNGNNTYNSGPNPQSQQNLVVMVPPSHLFCQPRDKKCTKFRASLRSCAPNSTSPHPPLTCTIYSFLFASIVCQLRSLFRMLNYTKLSESRIRAHSLHRVQKPAVRSTAEASQSLSSPGSRRGSLQPASPVASASQLER